MTTTALELVNAATGELVPAPFDMDTFLSHLATPGAIAAQQKLMLAYDTACAALIGPNDVQQEGQRTFKKKSAWRKLARYFGISVACDPKDVRVVPGVENGDWLIYCTATARSPWGQSWSDVGACGSDEETGRRTLTYADAIATAMTRASNRAVSNLIAMGEVSADELSQKRTPNGQGGGRITQSTQSKRAPTVGPVVVPPCPACGGEMFDNREKKASGKYKATAADFRCKNKDCDESVWLDAKPAKANARVGATDDFAPLDESDASVTDESESLPF